MPDSSLSWSSGITGEAEKTGEGPAQRRAGRHRKPIKTKPALDADLGGLQKVLTCVSLDCEMGQTIPSSAIKFNVEKAWRQSPFPFPIFSPLPYRLVGSSSSMGPLSRWDGLLPVSASKCRGVLEKVHLGTSPLLLFFCPPIQALPMRHPDVKLIMGPARLTISGRAEFQSEPVPACRIPNSAFALGS